MAALPARWTHLLCFPSLFGDILCVDERELPPPLPPRAIMAGLKEEEIREAP